MSTDIQDSKLSKKCTICRNVDTVFEEHPVLKVLVCQSCSCGLQFDEESSSPFCVWCCRNSVAMCLRCGRADCCEQCLRANKLSTASRCLHCNPNSIWQLRALCSVVLNQPGSPSVLGTAPINSPSVKMKEEAAPSRPVDNSGEDTRQTSLDLDCILGIYEKQIRASLCMPDSSVTAMVAEINAVGPDQVRLAVRVMKRCLAAFASDLANFEARLDDAIRSTGDGLGTDSSNVMTKMASLLKIVMQHHLFNRLAHPLMRMKEEMAMDAALNGESLKQTVPEVPPARVSKINSGEDAKVQEMLQKIKTICQRQQRQKHRGKQKGCAQPQQQQHSEGMVPKRRRVAVQQDGGNSVTSMRTRRTRNLQQPAWMQDFRLDKENEAVEVINNNTNDDENDDDDEYIGSATDDSSLGDDGDDDDEWIGEGTSYHSGGSGKRSLNTRSSRSTRRTSADADNSVSNNCFPFSHTNHVPVLPSNSAPDNLHPFLFGEHDPNVPSNHGPVVLSNGVCDNRYPFSLGKRDPVVPSNHGPAVPNISIPDKHYPFSFGERDPVVPSNCKLTPIRPAVGIHAKQVTVGLSGTATSAFKQPLKQVLINDKEPRYCVPKYNGESLMSTK